LLDQASEAGKNNPAIRDQIMGAALSMGDMARIQQLADHAVQTLPQDPQSHLALAMARGVQKDQAGAWRETLAALDLQPAFQPALTALRMMSNEPAQRDELLGRYAKAVSVKGASAQAFLDYARLLRDTKSSRNTILTLLEKGVNAVPDSTPLREALTDEYFRAGKPDSALSTAQAGASASNAPPEALGLLAITYERMDDKKLATETYRKLATNYPQRADWKLKLAEFEVIAGHKKEATSILHSLITDRPFDPSAYIALAKLTVVDNPREALSIAHELGERQPNKLTAMLLEGDLLAQSGQLDDALIQYGKAAKAGVVPAALLRTVEILDRSKREPAAEQELADALRKYPEDPLVVGFAAQRLRNQGKSAKAVELLQKLADKNPRNPFLLNDLAWAQLETKQMDALKNAAKADELSPDNPQILDTLALAQAQAGKQSEAIATLRTVMTLAPKASIPKLHLAELLLAGGDKKEAGTLLKAIDKSQLGSRDQESLQRMVSSVGSS
jgi:Flp pilus assembly protein TadD